MRDRSHRVKFLDYMRGFAVIVMVMGHSIDSVLSQELRMTDGFKMYDAFRGFTAPMFLFVAGFAYMVATARKWDAYRTFGNLAAKRILKVVTLLVIGYALHLPYLSLEKIRYHATDAQMSQFLQADVLHLVAVCLLVLQIVLMLAPSRRWFTGIIGSVAALIVLSAPVVWRIDFAPIVSPVVSPYFNQMQQSLFPVFPFGAFMLSGVVVGHFYLNAKELGRESEFIRGLIVASVVTVALAAVFDWLPVYVYPEHDYWKTSPNWFAVRVGIVAIASALFYYIRRMPALVEKNLAQLGQSSLMIYAIHLVVVYGSAANAGLFQQIGQTLAPQYAIAVATTVLFSMVLLTYAWSYMRRNYVLPVRFIQVGLVSTLLYSFVSRPW